MPLKTQSNHSSAEKLRPLTASKIARQSSFSRSVINSAERSVKTNPYASLATEKNKLLSFPSIQKGVAEIAQNRKLKSQKPTLLVGGGSQERYNSAATLEVNNSIDSFHLLTKNTQLLNAQSHYSLKVEKQRPKSSQNQRYASQDIIKRKAVHPSSNIHIVEQDQKMNHQGSALTFNTLSTEPKIPVRLKSQERNFQDISPELAAQIVRHHILPMFEAKPGHRNTGSVYKELKLSDQLNQELQLVREQVQQLQEKLQINTFQKEKFASEAKQIKTKYLSQQSKVKNLKATLETTNQTLLKTQQVVLQLELQSEQMKKFLQLQQDNQVSTAQKLKDLLYQCDKLQGQFDHMNHNQTLKMLQHEVIQEETSKLFKQLGQLPDTRAVQERSDQMQDFTAKRYDGLLTDYEKLQRNFQDLMQEKDIIMGQNRDIKDIKLKQDQQRMLMLVTCKTQVQMMEAQVTQRNEEAIQMRDTILKLESENNILERERFKLRQRCNKLKARRGIDRNFLLCKNCGKEYQDNENYNWSCRTHQSEFSGEMWWCCGKTSKDAVGCKFRKHEVRNEDQEDEDLDGQSVGVKKLIRCQCCKQVGHATAKCPNDPNFRTISNQINMQDAYHTDEMRIANSAMQKKNFAQTIVQTTHFLKKCVIQPMKDIAEAEDRESPILRVSSHPFKRGVMDFEDYNYVQFNPYILVSDKKVAYKIAREEESKGIHGNAEVLTENKLENINQTYDHESLISRADEHVLVLEEKEKQAAREDENLSQASQGELAAEQAEEIEDEDENTLVVFFQKSQIDEIKKKQGQDQFSELFEMKSEIKYLEIATGKMENAIQIMQYAPKAEVKVEIDKKKKLTRRKFTATDDADEQFQQDMAEYKSADINAGKTPQQLEQENEERTLKQLRVIEEKMIYKDISQLLQLKQTKFANDKLDKELAEEAQSEKASSEDQTSKLGQKQTANSQLHNHAKFV